MMVHEIEGYDCTFKEVTPKEEDYLLAYNKNTILLLDNKIPQIKDFKEAKNIHYGFSIKDKRYFICLDDLKGNYEHIEIFRNYEPRSDAFAFVTGLHLYSWYKKHVYCGRCGKLLIHTKNERRMECSSCGNLEFPTISPAMIIAIIHDDKILLTRYTRGYAPLALIAGYSEIGETLEETVAREVYEETNLKVKDVRYIESQPWGLSGSLLMGFVGKLDGDNNIKFNDNELKEARWFTREEIDLEDDKTSLTRDLILKFKNHLL